MAEMIATIDHRRLISRAGGLWTTRTTHGLPGERLRGADQDYQR
jgi:hypothetical protein